MCQPINIVMKLVSEVMDHMLPDGSGDDGIVPFFAARIRNSLTSIV
jgi:hypothetical protein